MSSPRTLKMKQDAHVENEPDEAFDIRVLIPENFKNKSFQQVTQEIATVSAPDLSIPFLGLFCVSTFFYESHTFFVGLLILTWVSLQFVTYVMDEDFRSDIFWNAFSLLGYFIFYLILGLIWSFAKLYLDVWQGNLSPTMMRTILTCVGTNGESGCIKKILYDMKLEIIKNMMAAPISFVYTFARDPLRLLNNVIFDTFITTYATILKSAVEAYQIRISNDLVTNQAASWSALGWIVLYIFLYLVVGYGWTHLKLFVEILNGTLPKRLDTAVRAVWKGDGNYWPFIKSIKHLVLSWMLFWPISMIYTFLRHPIRIMVDLVYHLSQRKYIWIVTKAMQYRDKTD